MVDVERLDQLLARLNAYRRAPGRLGEVPRSVFLHDPDKIGSAKYHFVVAIECCIDIGNHIVASESFRVPADNVDTFAVLVDEGIVRPSMLEPLRSMARLCNRLVHIYWDVHDDLVYETLATRLSDLDAFRAQVAAWLADRPS